MVVSIRVLVPLAFFVATVCMARSFKKVDILRQKLHNTEGFESCINNITNPDKLDDFADFTNKHGRKFSNVDEFKTRFENFAKCHDRIAQANANEKGTAKHGVTKFADFSPEEFHKFFTGHIPPKNVDPKSRQLPEKSSRRRVATTAAPTSAPSGSCVDYRSQNVVTAIKDQGQCGDCYAFASMAILESAYALKYGTRNPNITDYSEAEVTDCTFPEGNEGCNGGNAYGVFQYIMNKPGVSSEQAYPFDANADHTSCHLPANAQSLVTSGISQDFEPTYITEQDMLQWLNEYGPMYIAIDSTPLQTYQSGILNPPIPENGWNIDHAVAVVGYCVDQASGLPYWIVKNSWGTDWGEDGYFRLVFGQNALSLKTNPVWVILD